VERCFGLQSSGLTLSRANPSGSLRCKAAVKRIKEHDSNDLLGREWPVLIGMCCIAAGE
jgi:hypothetical protein